VEGIPVVKTVFGDVAGIPEPQEGTTFVVSTLVLQALKESGAIRDDLVSPDTGNESVIRDDDGKIVGVRRFQVL
jgi:hypothetical protein